MKKPGCKTVALLLFIYCFVQSGLAQNKTLSDLAIKIGAGNNISTLNFFTNETIANTPNSGFLNVGLTAHINERNNHSLFAGLQMEAINYYPSLIEKTNLGFVSLLAGRTTRFDLAGNHLYLNQTNGLSLNTLVEATSSNVNTTPYYGNPFKNLNIGVFSQLQIMRAGEKQRTGSWIMV